MNDDIVIDMSFLTDLTKDSNIIINIGTEDTYKFKPISLKIYSQYEKLGETDEILAKGFLISACSVDPIITEDDAKDMIVGRSAVIVKHLLQASFLMSPASI